MSTNNLPLYTVVPESEFKVIEVSTSYHKDYPMTHGEAYFHKRNQLGLDITELSRLPKRMPRKVALAYYCRKLKEVFNTSDKIRDFLKVEHFYDSYEAERLLLKLKR